MKRIALSVAAALLLLVLSLSGNQGKKYDVSIHDFKFDPASITVPAGSTVTWTNHDAEPHRVMSKDKKFSSKVLSQNDEYSNTFTTPGTYDYYCSIHPKMTGSVVVQ